MKNPVSTISGELRALFKGLSHHLAKQKSLKELVPVLEWSEEQVRREGYFSQFGQDKIVAQKTGFKRNGVFCDIGAADGIFLNNSYYFEKELGWTGLAIEPHPELFQKLKNNRKCTLINGCITGYTGWAKYNCLEGGFSTLSKIVHEGSAVQPGENDNLDLFQDDTILVPCFNLEDLFKKHGLDEIDFLSIDTEGEELNIIQTIDFRNVRIDFITIEQNEEHEEVKKLLLHSGFRSIAFSGCDEIFQRKKRALTFLKPKLLTNQ